MPNRKSKRAASIAALNDQMRREPRNKALGQVVITAGVAAEGDEFRLKVKEALAALGPRVFTPANDPYGEHDFCAFQVDGKRLFFKVDLYEAVAVKYYFIAEPLYSFFAAICETSMSGGSVVAMRISASTCIR